MQTIGGYFIIAGEILGLFPNLAAIGAAFTEFGAGLESGNGTVGPVFVGGNFTAIGNDFRIAGSILMLFGPSLAQVGQAFVTLGAELPTGTGSVGPIRIGNYGITLSFVPASGREGIELTLSVAPWQPAAA